MIPRGRCHLTRAAFALVAAFGLLAVTGCGNGATKKRHDAVTQYILSVDKIQAKLAAPLLAISKANRDFAQNKSDPATIARKLHVAAAKVDALRLRLAAIDPPPDAAKLQPLLVELAQREVSLAREAAALVLFQPAFSSALRPLSAAGTLLKDALKSKAKPAVKAAALDAYASAIVGVLDRLARLHPPPVSAALYRNQRATLEEVGASATALAQGLRDKHAKNLAALLHRFNAAAVANQSLAAQRSEIQAIHDYDARIRSIDRLAIRVHREQGRLQGALG